MWVKRIKDAYRVVECLVAALYLCFYSIFYYLWIHNDSPIAYAVVIDVTSSLDLVIALMFMGSSIQLVRFVKNTTGKKPNLRLLVWHFVNMILLTAILIVQTVFAFECGNLQKNQNSSPNSCEKKQIDQANLQLLITQLIFTIFSAYVDIFLLYLLYRFTCQ